MFSRKSHLCPFFVRRVLLGVLSLAAVSGLHAETDPHSYAQPDKVRVSALALDLDVSFERHQLAGSAVLSLDWLIWPRASWCSTRAT